MLFKMTLIYGLSPKNPEINVKNEDLIFSFDQRKQRIISNINKQFTVLIDRNYDRL